MTKTYTRDELRYLVNIVRNGPEVPEHMNAHEADRHIANARINARVALEGNAVAIIEGLLA